MHFDEVVVEAVKVGWYVLIDLDVAGDVVIVVAEVFVHLSQPGFGGVAGFHRVLGDLVH